MYTVLFRIQTLLQGTLIYIHSRALMSDTLQCLLGLDISDRLPTGWDIRLVLIVT